MHRRQGQGFRERAACLRRRAPRAPQTRPPAAAERSAAPCACRGEARGHTRQAWVAGCMLATPGLLLSPLHVQALNSTAPRKHPAPAPALHPPPHELQRRLRQPPQRRAPLQLLLLQVRAVVQAARPVLGLQRCLALLLPPLLLGLQARAAGVCAALVTATGSRAAAAAAAEGSGRHAALAPSAPRAGAAPAAGAAASPGAPAPPLCTCGAGARGRKGMRRQAGVGAPLSRWRLGVRPDGWHAWRRSATAPSASPAPPTAPAHSFSRWCSSFLPWA